MKNRQRWNFGVLSPRQHNRSQQPDITRGSGWVSAQSGGEAWTMQTECLLRAKDEAVVDVKIRFLHLVSREIAKLESPISGLDNDTQADYHFVDELRVGERSFQPWQEAIEREVDAFGLILGNLATRKHSFMFSFPASRKQEPLREPGGPVVGLIVRTQEEIAGLIEISAEGLANAFHLNVSIKNLTPANELANGSRTSSLLRSMVSVHTILSAEQGRFVSLIDPPEELRGAVAECSNVGTWPVLAGDDGEETMMLSSPIILYDYPQVAAESAGDLCDATETDELLTLCIMSLTDDEKRQMVDADDRARRILERTETLPSEQLLKMHGAIRGLRKVEEKNQ
jgi:hypothetical protein